MMVEKPKELEKLKQDRYKIERQKNDILYTAIKEKRKLSAQESQELLVLHEQVIQINRQIKKLNSKDGDKK